MGEQYLFLLVNTGCTAINPPITGKKWFPLVDDLHLFMKQEIKRNANGQFEKGTVANPNGRPRNRNFKKGVH